MWDSPNNPVGCFLEEDNSKLSFVFIFIPGGKQQKRNLFYTRNIFKSVFMRAVKVGAFFCFFFLLFSHKQRCTLWLGEMYVQSVSSGPSLRVHRSSSLCLCGMFIKLIKCCSGRAVPGNALGSAVIGTLVFSPGPPCVCFN